MRTICSTIRRGKVWGEGWNSHLAASGKADWGGVGREKYYFAGNSGLLDSLNGKGPEAPGSKTQSLTDRRHRGSVRCRGPGDDDV